MAQDTPKRRFVFLVSIIANNDNNNDNNNNNNNKIFSENLFTNLHRFHYRRLKF